MTDWFGVEAFIPHGFCLSWDPYLMAAMVVSNGLIALAYMIITVTLAHRALEPRPLMPRWLYWAFATFIFCCGLTHVLDNVTLWLPLYRVQAVILGITALVSLFTAMLPVSVWVSRHMLSRHDQ
jgi:hypothetical protein